MRAVLSTTSAPTAHVIEDTISPDGVRVVTVEKRHHRFTLAEENTHGHCLAGDVELIFDAGYFSPVAGMSIAEFHDRWHHAGGERDVLSAMRLRSVNESTGEIIHTKVVNVWRSGVKPVFRLTLRNGMRNGAQITASKDHLFFTDAGWLTLEEATKAKVHGGTVSWVPGSARFAVDGDDAAEVRFVEAATLELLGEQETYDIEVAGPFHNFVANRVVVHNSKNSASTRARPTVKVISEVLDDVAYPVEFGTNQPSMQAGPPLVGDFELTAMVVWLRGALNAVQTALELMTSPATVANALAHRSMHSLAAIGGVPALASITTSPRALLDGSLRKRDGVKEFVAEVLEALDVDDKAAAGLLNVHKQIAGRVLEPFMWHTAVHTAHLSGPGSSWENMFNQRCTPKSGKRLAQPEFADCADAVMAAIEASTPKLLLPGEWHKPYLRAVDREQIDEMKQLAVAVARVARTSYVTQAGVRDLLEDGSLFLRLALATPPHWSPFEHVATPDPGCVIGRIPGWRPLRHHPEHLAAVIDNVRLWIPEKAAA